MNKKPWRYRIDYLFTYQSVHLLGVVFENEWVLISNGVITMKQDYAWNGCSPAWLVPVVRWWWGIPDGALGVDGRPQTYFATLVHDALCQFNHEIPISKRATVALFKEILLRDNFPKWLTNLYSFAVNLLGPQQWGNITSES